MKTISAVGLSAGILLLALACKHTPLDTQPPGGGNSGGGSTVPCDPNKVYFNQQVLPILISNCSMSGCHDQASHEGDVILISYTSVMTTGDIRVGNPGESDLYKKLVDTDPGDRMPPPPQNPLTSQQIDLVRRWILQGADNLTCQSLCDTTSFTFSAAIKPMIELKCQGCHSGVNAQGGIDLTTYANVKLRIDDGKFWGSVNHQVGYSPMPKNGNKLSDCELTQIRKWIEAGSPNN